MGVSPVQHSSHARAPDRHSRAAGCSVETAAATQHDTVQGTLCTMNRQQLLMTALWNSMHNVQAHPAVDVYAQSQANSS